MGAGFWHRVLGQQAWERWPRSMGRIRTDELRRRVHRVRLRLTVKQNGLIMDCRIANTFTDSLAKLNGDEQKSAKTTAFDLQLNPVGVYLLRRGLLAKC